jgi:hypothetical protein
VIVITGVVVEALVNSVAGTVMGPPRPADEKSSSQVMLTGPVIGTFVRCDC